MEKISKQYIYRGKNVSIISVFESSSPEIELQATVTDSEGNSEVTDGGGAGGGVTEASPLNDLQVQLVLSAVGGGKGTVKLQKRVLKYAPLKGV